jgi:hypothetical protein
VAEVSLVLFSDFAFAPVCFDLVFGAAPGVKENDGVVVAALVEFSAALVELPKANVVPASGWKENVLPGADEGAGNEKEEPLNEKEEPLAGFCSFFCVLPIAGNDEGENEKGLPRETASS